MTLGRFQAHAEEQNAPNFSIHLNSAIESWTARTGEAVDDNLLALSCQVGLDFHGQENQGVLEVILLLFIRLARSP